MSFARVQLSAKKDLEHFYHTFNLIEQEYSSHPGRYRKSQRFNSWDHCHCCILFYWPIWGVMQFMVILGHKWISWFGKTDLRELRSYQMVSCEEKFPTLLRKWDMCNVVFLGMLPKWKASQTVWCFQVFISGWILFLSMHLMGIALLLGNNPGKNGEQTRIASIRNAMTSNDSEPDFFLVLESEPQKKDFERVVTDSKELQEIQVQMFGV